MYAMDFEQVGNNIKNQLDARGLTQQNLAEALGISKQVMNKIIKGYKAINVNELVKIADALGTSTDTLLLLESEPATVDILNYMGNVTDESTRDKVNMLRTAIDEIHMLEELLDE